MSKLSKSSKPKTRVLVSERNDSLDEPVPILTHSNECSFKTLISVIKNTDLPV